MRKLLFTFVFAIMSITAFAQGEHMTFKGIPMQGPLNDFVQKLKGKGFTLMESTKETAILNGKFATYDNCYVYVYTEKNNVSSVAVMFPEQETWNAITKRYYNLKEMLTEKYGAPVATIERFSDREPVSDVMRFFAILKDECKYQSTFETKNGSMILSMIKVNFNTASVFIKYNDNINEEELRKTMMDDL